MAASESNEQRSLSKVIAEELGSFVKTKSSTFACGGEIPIRSSKEVEDPASGELASLPVAIRWDSHKDGKLHVDKVILPVIDSDGEKQLEKLTGDCQPASFGYKGEDILDETYRRATKMDRSTFSSDFSPYENGIIDTVAQVLLPNIGGGITTRGVRAELYKLNVYSAPSGFFKAHVDTPRSEAQFGSLVVSLPCRHEGGQLVVRHAGHDMTFDWSASKCNTEAIRWAAFYSDCEHEVLEMTDGHRITLTYNLYCAPGVGDLAGNCPAMDLCSLPLYEKVQEALAKQQFMNQGGYLGIICSHGYAHNTKEGGDALPGVLKGVDMAVYSVFRAHGLDVQVRAVADDREVEESRSEYDRSYGQPRPFRRMGKELGRLITTLRECGYAETSDEVWQVFPHDELQVRWLTDPFPLEEEKKRRNTDSPKEGKNVGFVHMTYGNQAGLYTIYTYAALLVKVPPAISRPQVIATRGKAEE